MSDDVDAMSDSHPHRRRTDAELDALVDGADDGSPLARYLGDLRHLGREGRLPVDGRIVSSPRDEAIPGPTGIESRSPMYQQPPSPHHPAISRRLAYVAAAAAVTIVAIGGAVWIGALDSSSGEPTDAAHSSSTTSVDPTTSSPSTTSVEPTTTLGPSTTFVGPSTSSPSTTFVGPSTSNPSTTSVEPTTTTFGPSTTFVDPTTTIRLGDSLPRLIEVADVATLRVAIWDGRLWLDAVVTEPGWTTATDWQADRTVVDLSFRSAGGDRVDVDIEPEDGRWRVRIRDRRTGDEAVTDLVADHPLAIATARG